MLKSSIVFSLLISLSACSVGQDRDSQAVVDSPSDSKYFYYGDKENNEVVKINYKTMELEKVIASSGIYPYEVANGFDNRLIVLNRGDTNIGVIENDTIEKVYNLEFKPRSISLNIEKKTILMCSASEPSMQILSDAKVYSDSIYKEPISFGGKGATGHSSWVNEEYFLLLDRTENTLELYKEGNTEVVSKLKTSSSVHILVKKDGYFYGTLEGVRDGVSPGIIKFKIAYGKFTEVNERLMSSLDNLPSDFNATLWGFHHFAFHPTQDYLYTGSYEGNVFVLDTDTLSLVDTFKSGRGLGHFKFYKDMLITTNHADNFKSFYDVNDSKNNKFIKNIKFSDKREDGVIMQSHTSHIIDGNLYFTYNTADESQFIKLDLETLEVVGKIDLPQRRCVMGALQRSIDQIDLGM